MRSLQAERADHADRGLAWSAWQCVARTKPGRHDSDRNEVLQHTVWSSEGTGRGKQSQQVSETDAPTRPPGRHVQWYGTAASIASVRERLIRPSASCSSRSSRTVVRFDVFNVLVTLVAVPWMMPLALSRAETSDCCNGQAKLADELNVGLMFKTRICAAQRARRHRTHTLSFNMSE